MRSQLTSGNLAQARSINVIGSTWRDSVAPMVPYDEFGIPFSAQPWAPGAAVHHLLRESSSIVSRMMQYISGTRRQCGTEPRVDAVFDNCAHRKSQSRRRAKILLPSMPP